MAKVIVSGNAFGKRIQTDYGTQIRDDDVCSRSNEKLRCNDREKLKVRFQFNAFELLKLNPDDEPGPALSMTDWDAILRFENEGGAVISTGT